MELHNLMFSLEYLVSNGRQVPLGGIILGGSAIARPPRWTGNRKKEKGREEEESGRGKNVISPLFSPQPAATGPRCPVA